MQGITNALIEGIFLGSITYDNGVIVAVYKDGDELPQNVEWTNAGGGEVYCAFIDPHVHDRPDEPHKEDPDHLEAACIAGGVGTIMTMPNDKLVPFAHPDQLEKRKQRWQNSKITVKHHIAVSRENLDIISSLGSFSDNSLGQVKEYDASTNNPNTLIDDYETQLKASEAIGKGGKIRLVHAEYEPALRRTRASIERERKLHIIDHCKLRAAPIEGRGIYEAVSVAKETGTPTHICHVSTALGIFHIKRAQDAGANVTFETCPHYWLMNRHNVESMLGFAKMNPALRGPNDIKIIEQSIINGTVSMIATDHAPHTIEEKQQQEYDKCPSGVPGVETAFLSTYQFKVAGLIKPQRFIDLTSRNAAIRFGLNKGELLPGYDADMVVIDPKQSTTFSNASQKTKCGWTYLDGVVMNGKITNVILNGQIVLQA